MLAEHRLFRTSNESKTCRMRPPNTKITAHWSPIPTSKGFPEPQCWALSRGRSEPPPGVGLLSTLWLRKGS